MPGSASHRAALPCIIPVSQPSQETRGDTDRGCSQSGCLLASRPWQEGTTGTGTVMEPLFPLPALFPEGPIDEAPCGQTAQNPP